MKKGFLPIKTNWFDRLFIGIITFIALQFFWMRFIEEFASIEISMIIGTVIGIYIILRGQKDYNEVEAAIKLVYVVVLLVNNAVTVSNSFSHPNYIYLYDGEKLQLI